MELRVQRWHVRYRLPGGARPEVRARAEAVHARAAEVCAETLDHVLGTDPTVYVVRRVRAALGASLSAATGDRVARRWGEQLARAISRAARAPAGAEVATFANTTEYAAALLDTVARGTDARADWRFAPLADLVRPSLAETAEAVLQAHPAPDLVAALHRLGTAGRVTAALSPVAAEVWAACRPAPARAGAGERPLFAAALELASSAGWVARGTVEPEAWFREYLATRPAPSDWGTRRGMTDGVVRALRLLARRGFLVAPERLDAGALAEALARYDWLDAPELTRAFTQLAAPEPDSRAPHVGPVARPDRLAELVRAALARCGPLPVPDRPDAPANALYALGAVLHAHPEQTGNDALPLAVERLLAELSRARTAGTVPVPVAPARARTGPAWTDSGAAGVALLFRAVLDLRLPAVLRPLLERPGADPDDTAALLIALGLRWTGSAQATWVDPGLAALAGVPHPVRVAEIAERWAVPGAEAHRTAREALLRVAAAHRLLPDGPLSAVPVQGDNGRSLLGGNAGARLWVLGERLASAAEIEGARARWLDLWPGGVEAADESPDDWAALAGGSLGAPDADLTLGLAAGLVVRAWARWLRRFEVSGTRYLLDQFVRRPGRVSGTDRGALVELTPRPLDPVLRLAGYFDPVERVPWLGNGTVRFAVRGDE